MKTLLISAGVVVAVLAIIGGIVLWAGGRAKGIANAAASVRTENPARADLSEVVNAPGETQPLQKVVISARASARITELPYKAGEHVTKGDPDADPPIPPSVLVRLDSTELEAALRSAESRRDAQKAQIQVENSHLVSQEAGIKGTRARLEDAQRELDRVNHLLQSKIASQSEADTAQCNVQDLEAQVLAAESNIEAARSNLDVMKHNLASAEAEVARVKDNLTYITIMSPIDGVVTKVNAAVGELAITGTMNNPGTVILEVADLSQMLLVAQIDESDIGSVEAGQKAFVRIQAYPNKVFEGMVQNVALTHILSQTRSKVFEARILLNTEGQTIFSGLTADVDIETHRHQGVLKVPSQAVLARKSEELPLEVRTNNPNVDMSKADATVVYRLIADKAVVTPVKIGPSDITHTLILSGVDQNDKVIVGPYKVLENLQHNQAVRDERASQPKQTGQGAPASAPSTGPATQPATTPAGP